jgi:hypothetical protein
MIRAIEIENFKGISTLQRLEFSPVTLLFGPNSAGKSTILHALHYAYEVLIGRNCEVDQTAWGGAALDLGGFRSLVYGHNLDARVVIRIEVDVTDETLADYSLRDGDVRTNAPDVGAFENVDDHVNCVWIRVEVGWNRSYAHPAVLSYEVGVNDRESAVVKIQASGSAGQPAVAALNTKHEIFDVAPSEFEETRWIDELVSASGAKLQAEQFAMLSVFDAFDAVPAWGRALKIAPGTDAIPESKEMRELWRLVSKFAVGGGELVTRQLAKMLYVGPLREIPPRTYRPRLSEQRARWAGGLGAWDALYRDRSTLVAKTSEWLQRLQTGYRLEKRTVVEIDATAMAPSNAEGRLPESVPTAASAFDEESWKLAKGQASAPTRTDIVIVDQRNDVALRPNDVGVGISQLLPVIVGALFRPSGAGGGIVLVEQPELHVHPRVQVALADLFIEQSDEGAAQHQFLLETHSEHLLLRFLRRIREAHADREQSARWSPERLAVYYSKRSDVDGLQYVRLPVDSSGEFTEPWPDGYFDERFEEVYGAS